MLLDCHPEDVEDTMELLLDGVVVRRFQIHFLAPYLPRARRRRLVR